MARTGRSAAPTRAIDAIRLALCRKDRRGDPQRLHVAAVHREIRAGDGAGLHVPVLVVDHREPEPHDLTTARLQLEIRGFEVDGRHVGAGRAGDFPVADVQRYVPLPMTAVLDDEGDDAGLARASVDKQIGPRDTASALAEFVLAASAVVAAGPALASPVLAGSMALPAVLMHVPAVPAAAVTAAVPAVKRRQPARAVAVCRWHGPRPRRGRGPRPRHGRQQLPH